MTLDEITKEAESFFPTDRKYLVPSVSELLVFTKHILDKAQQWRPLTESMPEPMVQVLMWDGAHVFVEQWWGEGYLLDHRITHWMPIPTPPEAA